MQLSRLFEIVYILLHKKRATAKELAERFEVSQRTIYRDIETLGMAGIPVYCIRGSGGGICIHERFVLNKSALTQEEQAQILLALKSLSATDHEGAGTLLGKLGSLFAKDEDEWIEVDFSRWGHRTNDRRAMAVLRDAIIGQRKIAFQYYSMSSGRTNRTVCPVKLIYKDHSWYLHAFDDDRLDYRTFKLHRCVGITPLDQAFDRNAFPDIRDVELPPRETRLVTVKLLFQPASAFRVFDAFDPETFSHGDDGSIAVTACMEDDGTLCAYLFTLGPGVQVLSPTWLRKRMAKHIQAALAQYENS